MIYDFIQIDKTAKQPMYAQLYSEIKKSILDGRMEIGAKVPSIRMAAEELDISTTTVETAYIQLCTEGFLESRPQRGYFVRMPFVQKKAVVRPKSTAPAVQYNFSSEWIDMNAADIPLWRKCVRAALNNPDALIFRGEPQGELALREAVAAYVYEARGVVSQPENLLIGAGIQPLFTLLCSLIDREAVIALDAPGFKQAEQIFKDFGFDVVYTESRCGQSIQNQLDALGATVYLDISANRPKMSITDIQDYRASLFEWLNENDTHYLLEDDYNGDLRVRERPLAAMQEHNPKQIVYLGSFSKLLLPAVRISYMILPYALLQDYEKKAPYYNQSASKIEQIALGEYIRLGHLEKHLRRLRKLYYKKSKHLCTTLEEQLPGIRHIEIFETSLLVGFHLPTKLMDSDIRKRALDKGVQIESVHNKYVRLSFSGILDENIEPAVHALKEAWCM